MNILTKISVVLLVVASLAASVVFTSLATTHYNWRHYYELERETNQRLVAKNRQLKEVIDRQAEQAQQTRTEAATQVSQLRSKVAELQSAKSQLEIKHAQLQNQLTPISSQLMELSESYKTQGEFLQSTQDQLLKTRNQVTEMQQELIRVSAMLREKEASVEQLQKNLKVFKEIIQDQKATIAELNQQVAAGGTTRDETRTAAAPAPESKISGAITAVRDNLAQVNVGSAHGLQDGMMLIVYRGDQYVGKLKVEQVRANEAAGIIMDKRLSPQQGDKVTSHLD